MCKEICHVVVAGENWDFLEFGDEKKTDIIASE